MAHGHGDRPNGDAGSHRPRHDQQRDIARGVVDARGGLDHQGGKQQARRRHQKLPRRQLQRFQPVDLGAHLDNADAPRHGGQQQHAVAHHHVVVRPVEADGVEQDQEPGEAEQQPHGAQHGQAFAQDDDRERQDPERCGIAQQRRASGPDILHPELGERDVDTQHEHPDAEDYRQVLTRRLAQPSEQKQQREHDGGGHPQPHRAEPHGRHRQHAGAQQRPKRPQGEIGQQQTGKPDRQARAGRRYGCATRAGGKLLLSHQRPIAMAIRLCRRLNPPLPTLGADHTRHHPPVQADHCEMRRPLFAVLAGSVTLPRQR